MGRYNGLEKCCMSLPVDLFLTYHWVSCSIVYRICRNNMPMLSLCLYQHFNSKLWHYTSCGICWRYQYLSFDTIHMCARSSFWWSHESNHHVCDGHHWTYRISKRSLVYDRTDHRRSTCGRLDQRKFRRAEDFDVSWFPSLRFERQYTE